VNATSENARASVQPSLLRSLRGLWLFAWKSRLSWRRAPGLLGGLAILPFLVYLTVSSPNSWKRQENLPLPNQSSQLWQFERRLGRNNSSLTQEQRDQLKTIIQTEYDRVQSDWRDLKSPETSVDQQRVIIGNYFDGVLAHAKSVLDDDQFVVFRIWNRESLARSQTLISEPAWNRTSPFYHWLVDFYFFIILPLGCVRATGGLVRDELQSDTLGFLLTRPVKRAALLLLKFVCEVAWLEILALAESLLLFGAGHLREIPSFGALIPLFLATQFLAVLAWSALGVFLGQVTKRYLALALIYGLVVELGIGAIPTNINSLSLMRHLQALLSHNNELQSLFQWSNTGTLFPAGMLLLATAIFLTAASVLFTFLEYHSTEEMRK
jgi:ABC-type transport system involved in multi-copper enzyme maturation permease subunit